METMNAAAPVKTASATPPGAPAGRVASMDAYRGFVMVLMMAEVLQFKESIRRAAGQLVLGLPVTPPKPRRLERLHPCTT